MLAKRYTGRPSIFSQPIQPSNSVLLKKLSHYSMKKPVQKTQQENKPQNIQIDEVDPNGILTNVPITKQKNRKDISFKTMPLLPIPYSKTRQQLLLKKIQLCTTICNYADPDADLKAKAIKTEVIKEITRVFSTKEGCLEAGKECIDALFEMIGINLFRSFPRINPVYLASSEEPIIIDINWPHNSLLYALLIQFQTIFPDEPHFDYQFQKNIIHCLHSCDSNEREIALRVLLSYTDAFPQREVNIWKQLENILIDYLNDDCDPFAVSPILRYFLRRFQNPTVDYQSSKTVFYRSILPLLSSQHIKSISPYLIQLIKMFIDQNPKEILVLMNKRFPTSKPSKQLPYISLHLSILEFLSESSFKKALEPIIEFYKECALSPHSRVVEISVQFWFNNKIYPIIMDLSNELFPVFMEIYQKISNTHWCQTTRQAASNALKAMRDMDSAVFDELSMLQKRKTSSESAQAKNWISVMKIASKADGTMNLPHYIRAVQRNFKEEENRN